MQYKRIQNVLFIRPERGEELLTVLKTACLENGVKLGLVSGIGATDDFTVGRFDLSAKRYDEIHRTGAHEIVSLLGNITTMNGEYYAHLHLAAADGEGQMTGGHLNRAVISATGEITVTILDGEVDRVRDEAIGINLWKLD